MFSDTAPSVVDRHRFDADPGPNFHVDADPDPDPDPDWHQYDAYPHADPTPSFTHIGKSNFFGQFTKFFSFSSVSKMS
jgi:hypothetical protein